MSTFYGKYRGTVKNNDENTAGDGKRLGRIQVLVPGILEENPSWALPCVPYAGPGVGFFMLPPAGANVWVEFEGGNPSSPIWSGCFWGVSGSLPPQASAPTQKLIATAGISLILDDTPNAGSITLIGIDPAASQPFLAKFAGTGMITLSVNPAQLTLTQDNIDINLGSRSIAITPASINLNDGALEVM